MENFALKRQHYTSIYLTLLTCLFIFPALASAKTLSWNAVPGATHYQVQIKRNDIWENLNVSQPQTPTSVDLRVIIFGSADVLKRLAFKFIVAMKLHIMRKAVWLMSALKRTLILSKPCLFLRVSLFLMSSCPPPKSPWFPAMCLSVTKALLATKFRLLYLMA